MTESIAKKVSKNLNPAGSRLIALHADRFQVKTDFGCPAEFIQLASIEVKAEKQSGGFWFSSSLRQPCSSG